MRYTQRALAIDEKVYGPEHPTVATRANNIGQILKAQGDLAGALRRTQRARRILHATYGPDNPSTRIVSEDVASIEAALCPKPA